MENSYYYAIICEGSAEEAIMEILIENDLLHFKKEDLLEEQVIRCRSPKKFEERYLRTDFSRKIKVYRILDSHKEKFKLSKTFQDKVEVETVVTSPEIEMLIIHAENAYKDYLKKKSKVKPSDYCKTVLKLPKVKEYEWVKAYFSDVDKLLSAMKEYDRCTKKRKGELTLLDLVKK